MADILEELEQATSDMLDAADLAGSETPSEQPVEEASTAPSEDVQAQQTEAPQQDEELQIGDSAYKFLNKYGDINKAADAYWGMNNRLSEMAQKIKDLEANGRVNPPAPTDTRPVQQAPAPTEVAESIKAIESRKSYLVSQNNTALRSQQILANLKNESQNAAEFWANEILNPNSEFDQSQIRRELSAARANLQKHNADFQRLEHDRTKWADEYDGLLRETERETRLQNILTERLTEREERDRDQQTAFASTFTTSAEQAAKRAGISQADYPRFFELARRSAIAEIAERQYDNPDYKIENVDRFLGDFAREYSGSSIKIARQQMRQYTQAKLGDNTRRAPAKGMAPESPKVNKTIKELPLKQQLAALEEKTDFEVDQAYRAARG